MVTVVRHCPDCELKLTLPSISIGQEAVCPRCSALLQTPKWRQSEVFALWLAGILFWGASCLQPLLSIEVNGVEQGVFWYQLAEILWHKDAFLLSFVIALTTLVAPFVYFVLLAWVLFPRALPVSSAWSAVLWQWLSWSRAGLMLEVFFLGILVSAVKLSDVAQVIPNWSLAAFVGLMLVVSALSLVFSPPQMTHASVDHPLTLAKMRQDQTWVWALLVSAWILYIPANLLPMMTVTSLGKTASDTIMDGIVHFVQAGQWHLALVIFVASILVPLTKLLVLMGLLLSSHFGWCQQLVLKTKVYRWIRWVGVWSMVDVFVITLLVGLVQFGELAQVQAGAGAMAFLGVIMLTVGATHLFHSRWLWLGCQAKQSLIHRQAG
jgi:paraquat-inducible protein A